MDWKWTLAGKVHVFCKNGMKMIHIYIYIQNGECLSHAFVNLMHPDLRNIVIELIKKSKNAPVPYPTMPHSEQNMHISVLNGAWWDMEHVHYGICENGILHFC